MEQHANQGKRGVRVYFRMNGTNDIYSDVVEKQVKNRLIFFGGDWNPTADCYLTAGQCRRAEGLWPQQMMARARQTLQTAVNALGEADARLAGAIKTLEEGRG